jgi:hypothetical protein
MATAACHRGSEGARCRLRNYDTAVSDAVTFPKIVDDAHYHLWTDALHGRALAKQAKNRWDRSTYVRWTVTTAWTVLEMACDAALETTGIGRRFKKNLNEACEQKKAAQIDWRSGVWQRVITLQKVRKDFVHINASQAALFPEVEEADRAITTVRDAIADISARVGKPLPDWLRDDDDRGWDRGPMSMAHAQVIHGGVDPAGNDTVRISYEYKDEEYDSDFCPPGTDPKPLVERLLKTVRIPITAVRAYSGRNLIYERKLQMRGT